MLETGNLSSSESAELCRLASEACSRRLDQIAEASDPSDHALQDLLRKMALEARAQTLDSWHRLEEPMPGGEGRLCREGLREFLRGYFLSLSWGMGEGTMGRDVALFFAESLKEEASRFYRVLAERSGEGQIQRHCSNWSERERGRLRFLREVVLDP